ncbi:Inner membrane protein YbhN [Pigmentiphaga humi]|uniref:Inner membrane protein YbhN n=1 Tax=Pigmentiphaga humi TaxID=2478468 RepID=A0A3P4B981_9BURK|nr:lysylphosphatidylglycerol synthase domain-containing protein [Pigmentiphaga humi]VCU72160.1 Inner membrane protein YbhN [Pigmentiphaga humi]
MPSLAKPADGRAAGQTPNAPRHAGKRRAWWRWARHGLVLVFLAVVAVLLAEQVGKIEWNRVLQTLRGYAPATLAAAGGLTVASHLLFGAFDQLGRRYAGHRLGIGAVAAVAGVSYAFTLNLGALVGGVGFRYRLYSRLGLDPAAIGKIYALSVATNWLGYLVLLGGLFVAGAVRLPERWGIPAAMLPVIGALAWAAAAAYLAACIGWGGKRFQVRRVAVEWPRWPMAALQLALSVTNWTIMAGIVYLLLGGKVDYPAVLAVLLVSAVAGALTHVPAGLGVLEAVFIAMLADRMPAYELLAGLLAYRAIYYLGPLLPALACYGWMEARARRRPQAGTSS